MRPLLDCASDGKEHALREVIQRLVIQCGLTDVERKQLLPSGSQEVFVNRVAWAKTHLKMAGLLDSPKRGYLNITPLGLNVLSEFPERIDLKVLRLQPGYLEARGGTKNESQNKTSAQEVEASQTPEEQIELAFLALRSSLGSEILSKLRASSPSFFLKISLSSCWLPWATAGLVRMLGKPLGEVGTRGLMESSKKIVWAWILSISKQKDGFKPSVGRRFKNLLGHFRVSGPRRAYS